MKPILTFTRKILREKYVEEKDQDMAKKENLITS